LRGAGTITLPLSDSAVRSGAGAVRLSTEDARFTAEPEPPEIAMAGPDLVISFRRPGATVFEASLPGLVSRGADGTLR
jgi:hypothetical protein